MLYIQPMAASEARQIAERISEECLGVRVRMLSRIVTRTYDELLRPHGIKFSQMNILSVLALHGPIQPVQVGRRLSIEKSTLSRNVRLMEANGWLENLPGEANTQLLRLTRRGRELYTKAAPAWQQAQERLAELLGDRATAALRTAVNRLRGAETGA